MPTRANRDTNSYGMKVGNGAQAPHTEIEDRICLNIPVLVCVFSVNFQNSEFRICIPLYMCIFSQFSETCYLIFWCMFLKIDWKYTYKGGMLILNSEFWKLTENTYILVGAHCMNLQIHQFSDQSGPNFQRLDLGPGGPEYAANLSFTVFDIHALLMHVSG